MIDKRLMQCFAADQAVERAQQLHAHFRYLYREIIQQLNTFDAAGRLREQNQAKNTIEAALELMEELGYQAMGKRSEKQFPIASTTLKPPKARFSSVRN